ncbi:MAG: nitrogenase iron protein [Geobacteraceae bacterium]|nr:MAG: nitrogenase iron protein [Geobacteraceae bacterium]
MAPKHIAIYGKGGVGTSTMTSNISAALAEIGYRVIQIGFDPKNESTGTLRGEREVTTLLEAVQKKRDVTAENVAVAGFKGVLCVEAGLPAPGVGCTGHTFGEVISLLKEPGLFVEHRPDFVIYDVSGDAVCGGIVAPLLNGIAERVYVVSSSDFMSLFAANGFFRLINEHGEKGGAAFGGLIANGLTAPFAESIVDDFARKTGSPVVGYVPRSLVVMQSELYGQTVIEAAPLSNHAYIYRRLARHIARQEGGELPQPLSPGELKRWARKWGDRILELETGVISEGEGI